MWGLLRWPRPGRRGEGNRAGHKERGREAGRVHGRLAQTAIAETPPRPRRNPAKTLHAVFGACLASLLALFAPCALPHQNPACSIRSLSRFARLRKAHRRFAPCAVRSFRYNSLRSSLKPSGFARRRGRVFEDAAMRCGGCGSKVSSTVLSRALTRVQGAAPPEDCR